MLSEMELAERADRSQDIIATAELENAEEDIGMQSNRDAICFICG